MAHRIGRMTSKRHRLAPRKGTHRDVEVHPSDLKTLDQLAEKQRKRKKKRSTTTRRRHA